MSLFGSTKKRSAYIFDIGSASVGGAVVEFGTRNKPVLIFTTRKKIEFQQNLSFDRLFSSMMSALQETCRELVKVKTSTPREKNVFMGVLASPWYASQTRIASFSDESNSFLITQKTIEGLLLKEIDEFKKNELEKIGKDATVLEHENMQVKLNGYVTEHPFGKQAKDIQAALYISMAPKKALNAIKKTIGGPFHTDKILFQTYPFVAFTVLRDLFHESSFLFLDITGEVTDVAFVSNGILQEVVSFPNGKNFLLRQIASIMNVSPDEALSLIRAHKDKKVSNDEKSKLDTVFGAVAKSWLHEFSIALERASEESAFLPSDIFFSSDNDVAHWFQESIHEEQIHQHTKTTSPFVPRFLSSEMFHEWCTISSKATADPFLMAETIFLNKMGTYDKTQ